MELLSEEVVTMGAENKIIYSVPKQVPLFEEQDDGDLIPYEQEK